MTHPEATAAAVAWFKRRFGQETTPELLAETIHGAIEKYLRRLRDEQAVSTAAAGKLQPALLRAADAVIRGREGDLRNYGPTVQWDRILVGMVLERQIGLNSMVDVLASYRISCPFDVARDGCLLCDQAGVILAQIQRPTL